MRGSWIVLALVAAASPAAAQSFNIDFGGNVPSPSYAGVGLPGTWNSVGLLLPSGTRQDLVGLDGLPSVARIYMIGATGMIDVDDPLTTGEDAALLDDMLISNCAPVDACVYLENLINQEYEVITYALTPSEPTMLSPVRVDFGSPGSVDVGGTWTGVHSEGLSYSRHLVTPSNGRIAFHSGTPSGFFQAGINGFQIRPTATTGVGSLSPAFRGVFPNPAAGRQRIEVEGGHGPLTIDILDVAGRLVWRESRAAGSGPFSFEWDGQDLAGGRVPAGLYLARVAGAPAASRKLVRVE